MATIVFLPDIDEIIGSRRGLTFDKSQAGNYVKKRPSPINHQTNLRMKYRSILWAANDFFWNLNQGQMNLWAIFAENSGIGGPWGMKKNQQACAGFFSCAVNAEIAGDGFPPVPGSPVPIGGVTFTNLVQIDKDTVRATFNPSPAGAQNRIYLRQALPGPGYRRWSAADGYIAEYSPMNPNSPFDFSTKFQHLTGWNGRYWCGTQNNFGGRAIQTLFDI